MALQTAMDQIRVDTSGLTTDFDMAANFLLENDDGLYIAEYLGCETNHELINYGSRLIASE